MERSEALEQCNDTGMKEQDVSVCVYAITIEKDAGCVPYAVNMCFVAFQYFENSVETSKSFSCVILVFCHLGR